MSIIQIVDLNGNDFSLLKNLFKLIGLCVAGLFVFTLIDILILQLPKTNPISSHFVAMGIVFGMIMGIYIGMCIQLTQQNKRNVKYF